MSSAQYKKPHIYFLQAMMNRGIVSKKECISICQKFCEREEHSFNGGLNEFLDVVNQQIHSFHFKVKQAKREDTGETVFVLVSLAETDLNRLVVGGDFSRQEIDMFKKILELIVYSNPDENNGMASSIDILNLADTISPKISKVEAKKILDRFVEDQWFYMKNGMVTLSPRTILELEVYLADVFKDFIQICQVCNMIVFCGKACSHCNARMHNFCADRYLSNSDSRKCLSCDREWIQTEAETQAILTTTTGEHSNSHHSNRRRR